MGGKYSGSIEVEGTAEWDGSKSKVTGRGSFEASTEKIAEAIDISRAVGNMADSATTMHREYTTHNKNYQK